MAANFEDVTTFTGTLTTLEVLNQSWFIDFMHDALICSRRFRTFNVVDYFNREALAIEIDLNIPAPQCHKSIGKNSYS